MFGLDRAAYCFGERGVRLRLENSEIHHEVQEFLAEPLSLLSLDFRAPLVLRDLEGWSNQEVADLLDLSVSAAKSRIHRARMKIRHDLELWLAERDPS